MSFGEIVTACLGSSGLTALILAVLQRRWAKEDKQDAIVAAIKVLTLDRVKYLAKCHIRDGYIDLGDKETLQDMHRAYKALGGNGTLDAAIAGGTMAILVLVGRMRTVLLTMHYAL